MPARLLIVAGTSRLPRSVRRKRMPKSAGAGVSGRLTLLPEWRPIPTQEICRRRVRCASIASQAQREKRERLSKEDARPYAAHLFSAMGRRSNDLDGLERRERSLRNFGFVAS